MSTADTISSASAEPRDRVAATGPIAGAPAQSRRRGRRRRGSAFAAVLAGLQVGDSVLAIGNPLGLGISVSNSLAVLVNGVKAYSDAPRRGVGAGDIILQVGRKEVATVQDFQHAIDDARAAGHQFAMLLVLPNSQPDLPTRFPGPSWIALQISNK